MSLIYALCTKVHKNKITNIGHECTL